jgi:hypothetical protein
LTDEGRDDFGCGDVRHWQVFARPTQSSLPHLHSVKPSELVQFARDRFGVDVSVFVGFAPAAATRVSVCNGPSAARVGSAFARAVTRTAMTSGRAVDVFNSWRMFEFLLFLVGLRRLDRYDSPGAGGLHVARTGIR